MAEAPGGHPLAPPIPGDCWTGQQSQALSGIALSLCPVDIAHPEKEREGLEGKKDGTTLLEIMERHHSYGSLCIHYAQTCSSVNQNSEPSTNLAMRISMQLLDPIRANPNWI